MLYFKSFNRISSFENLQLQKPLPFQEEHQASFACDLRQTNRRPPLRKFHGVSSSCHPPTSSSVKSGLSATSIVLDPFYQHPDSQMVMSNRLLSRRAPLRRKTITHGAPPSVRYTSGPRHLTGFVRCRVQTILSGVSVDYRAMNWIMYRWGGACGTYGQIESGGAAVGDLPRRSALH